MIHSSHVIRIARPSQDLRRAERFYVDGLGLAVLYRATGAAAQGEYDLLMLGPVGGSWHLELTIGAGEDLAPTPTVEDLLVIYLDAAIPPEMVARAEAHGGVVTTAHNAYWDQDGITLIDPDGYRVVLTSRRWGPNTAFPESRPEE